MFCPKCAEANNDFASFCTSCGTGLHAPRPEPALAEADEPVSRYEAFVGSRNTAYYASRFARFEQGGSRAGWHWPAFFCTFYWLLYRKMWLYAAVYFFLPYVLAIGAAALFASTGASQGSAQVFASVAWFAGFFILPPMFATSLYYNHFNAKYEAVAAGTSNRMRQLTQLAEKGGTSGGMLVVVGLIVLVFVVGMLAAIAIPAYQAYLTRARLAQAESVGRIAGESVAAHFYEHKTIPNSLDDTSFSAPLPQGVREMTLNPEDGSIEISIESENLHVDGKTLMLVPSVDAQQQIQWSCSSPDIDDQHLPTNCQGAGE